MNGTTRVSVRKPKVNSVTVESLHDGRFALVMNGITRHVSHDHEECVKRGRLLIEASFPADRDHQDTMLRRAVY